MSAGNAFAWEYCSIIYLSGQISRLVSGTSRVSAVAPDLYNVLVLSISAMVTAIRRIAGGRATTHLMSAFSFVSHFNNLHKI